MISKSTSEDAPNKIQLELHVPDQKIAKDFYEKLGFKVIWRRRKGDAGDYMVMERDGAILNFWPGNDHVWGQSYFKRFPKDTKRGYGVEIVYTVDDVESYYDKVKIFATIVEPLKLQPWGRYDFRFEDPFGFYLRVTEHHDIRESSEAVD
jgi:uncharacterized glyoxalase superfamily protein PhnB